MNIHRNTRTTSLVLSNNKALLDEARLQRCKQALPDDRRLDIIPYQSYYKLPEGNKTPIDSGSSKLTQNSDSSNEHARRLRRLTFISGNRLNDRYCRSCTRKRLWKELLWKELFEKQFYKLIRSDCNCSFLSRSLLSINLELRAPSRMLQDAPKLSRVSR